MSTRNPDSYYLYGMVSTGGASPPVCVLLNVLVTYSLPSYDFLDWNIQPEVNDHINKNPKMYTIIKIQCK